MQTLSKSDMLNTSNTPNTATSASAISSADHPPKPHEYPLRACPIPPTTIEHYITDIYALNIMAEDGSTADWHDPWSGKDNVVTVAGINTPSTNHIFADYGVIECKVHLFERMRLDTSAYDAVYRANFVRAVLDMVYRSLVRHGRKYQKVIALTGSVYDWFDREEDKLTFYDKCATMVAHIEDDLKPILNSWVRREIEYDKKWGEYTLSPELAQRFAEQEHPDVA